MLYFLESKLRISPGIKLMGGTMAKAGLGVLREEEPAWGCLMKLRGKSDRWREKMRQSMEREKGSQNTKSGPVSDLSAQ